MGTGNFSDDFKRCSGADHRAGLSRRGGFEAARRQPALAICVEAEVLETIRFEWRGSGGRDPSSEEGTGSRYRGARNLKKKALRISPRMQGETRFVAGHRQQFKVRAMCRCLRVRPGGFYA
jgi:hypothetical protein